MESKVHVFVRVRDDDQTGDGVWEVVGNTLYHKVSRSKRVGYSCFEKVFFGTTNKVIYNEHLRRMVMACADGTSCTIFAYGQTGSGKTHTMLGSASDMGLIRLSTADIFSRSVSEVRISYIEIYNEKIIDLIDTSRNVRLYDVSGEPRLSNASEVCAGSASEIHRIIERCEGSRRTGCTEFNKRSSRSHTIFLMRVGCGKVSSRLCLIDLAGSEKASTAHERRLEGSFINRSLLALGKVMNGMSKSGHISFRDSKLTRLLQTSMDGRTRVVALCMISPSKRCAEESTTTLGFAARLGRVKLEPKNEILGENARLGAVPCCRLCGQRIPGGGPSRKLLHEDGGRDRKREGVSSFKVADGQVDAGMHGEGTLGTGCVGDRQEPASTSGGGESAPRIAAQNTVYELSPRCCIRQLYSPDFGWAAVEALVYMLSGRYKAVGAQSLPPVKVCGGALHENRIVKRPVLQALPVHSQWRSCLPDRAHNVQQPEHMENEDARAWMFSGYRSFLSLHRGLHVAVHLGHLQDTGGTAHLRARHKPEADSEMFDGRTSGLPDDGNCTGPSTPHSDTVKHVVSGRRSGAGEIVQLQSPWMFWKSDINSNFYIEKLRIYRRRVDNLERHLARSYRDSRCERSRRLFLLEKSLFKMECRMVEDAFLVRKP